MQSESNEMERAMEGLINRACLAGATEVRRISPEEITVEEGLVRFCSEPRCENYGLSPSCPPHVAGPAGFELLRQKSRAALVVRLEVPSTVLFSSERQEVMRLLHEIVADLELQAIALGYAGSKAFAGGSCKDLFCHEHHSCRVLGEQGSCRNPLQARPSLSGFGVNVAKMMEVAGWSSARNSAGVDPAAEALSWVTGLVLIA